VLAARATAEVESVPGATVKRIHTTVRIGDDDGRFILSRGKRKLVRPSLAFALAMPFEVASPILPADAMPFEVACPILAADRLAIENGWPTRIAEIAVATVFPIAVDDGQCKCT
jgi:hypothetical protein